MTRLFSKAAIAVSLLSLAACDTLGNPFEVLGRKAPAPDEFQVVSRKPLVMPNSVALPEPRLGERSPLEPNPSSDAIAALLGTPTISTVPAGSAGEAALLAAANAGATDGDIRTKVEADRSNADANKPYEPPTVFELLGSDSDQEFPDALDADAEARRLQTQGVAAAPINPDDRPAGAVRKAAETEGSLIVREQESKPRNRLSRPNTGPAFE
ncbi:MAG: DUF3035 domain-containing protein [Pseudomonadota bacterium]